MTWVELVKKYFPNASEEEIDFILWEKTCFPMGSAEEVEKQLKKLKGIAISKVDWIKQGVEHGYCSYPVCEFHDGVPVTKEESEQMMEDNPCILIMRVYKDEDEKGAVESFSPFAKKDITCYMEDI